MTVYVWCVLDVERVTGYLMGQCHLVVEESVLKEYVGLLQVISHLEYLSSL